MFFKSNNKRNQTILEILIERICFLHYQPGERLSEVSLAQEFDVSRTPIRWALSQLSFLNLVETKLGSGNYVTELDLKEISALYDLRLALMDQVIPLGTHAFTPAFIEELEDIYRAIEQETMCNKEITSRYFIRDYKHSLQLIANKPLRTISYQLYIQSVRFWIFLLPENEVGKEMQGLKDTIIALLDAARADDPFSYFLIRKTALSVNYNKLKRWVI